MGHCVFIEGVRGGDASPALMYAIGPYESVAIVMLDFNVPLPGLWHGLLLAGFVAPCESKIAHLSGSRGTGTCVQKLRTWDMNSGYIQSTFRT